jgi:outer membrane cobalamin receptor
MGIKRLLLGFSFLIVGTTVFSQAETGLDTIPLQMLGAENLEFKSDSNRLKIISAGRISANLDDLPLEVYVISHEEILRNQYSTLTDVLHALPGIKTSRPGTGELGESFQIWGLTGNLYTKILVNGMPVKPSVVSGMPIGSQLPIRQAEKIEVIYGNSSAVYGADAVSGVINIITKEAEEGTFVRGDISLGKNGHNYFNFMIGGKGGKNNNILQYSFYGTRFEQNNMNLDYMSEGVYNPMNYYQAKGETIWISGDDYAPLSVDESVVENSTTDPEDFKNEYYGENYEGSITEPEMESLASASHLLGVQMRFKGLSFSYDYMYRKTHSSLGLSPVFYKYNNPQNFWGESISRTTVSYKETFGRITSTTQLNNLAYNMDNNSSQGVTFLLNTDKAYRYSASNDMEISQIFSMSPTKNIELVGGVSYTQSGNLPVTNYLEKPFDKSLYIPYSTRVDMSVPLLDSFGINPILFSNISGFLQFYTKWKKFRILGGLRYDVNTWYGNRFSPQISVLHKTTPKTSMRFSIGNAYKAPPASLMFQSLAYPISATEVDYKVAPNIGLRPEKFNTLEFGIKSQFRKKASVNQTFYYYRITNHIIPASLPIAYFDLPYTINDSVRTWINYGSTVSNVAGSQTTLRFTNIVESIKMNAEVSLTFQARQDKLPNVREFVAEYLKLQPAHSGKLKLSMSPADNMYLYIESHWMSKWLRLLIPFESLYDDLFGNTDGYYAMDAMVSYNLSDQLNIFVKVNNIFDEQYGIVNATILEENLIYNPQLRRTLRFGLSYKLN